MKNILYHLVIPIGLWVVILAACLYPSAPGEIAGNKEDACIKQNHIFRTIDTALSIQSCSFIQTGHISVGSCYYALIIRMIDLRNSNYKINQVIHLLSK